MAQTFGDQLMQFALAFDVIDESRFQDMHKPGDINEQLLEILGTCRYGICHLSEQVYSGEGNHVPKSTRNIYRDNANMVFEVGMLHGRSDASSPVPASWIPIREQSSPTSPFDFTSQRMIVAPRTTTGNLKKRTFEDLFRKQLATLAKKVCLTRTATGWDCPQDSRPRTPDTRTAPRVPTPAQRQPGDQLCCYG